jgi:hypothetical protein
MKRYRVDFERTSKTEAGFGKFNLFKTFLVYGENKNDAEKKAFALLTCYMDYVVNRLSRSYSRGASYATYKVSRIEISEKKEKFKPNVKSVGTKRKYVDSPMCPSDILSAFAKEPTNSDKEREVLYRILDHANTPIGIKEYLLERFKSSENPVDLFVAERYTKYFAPKI